MVYDHYSLHFAILRLVEKIYGFISKIEFLLYHF